VPPTHNRWYIFRNKAPFYFQSISMQATPIDRVPTSIPIETEPVEAS